MHKIQLLDIPTIEFGGGCATSVQNSILALTKDICIIRICGRVKAEIREKLNWIRQKVKADKRKSHNWVRQKKKKSNADIRGKI